MPVDPVRNAAVDVLLQVFEKGVFLDQALDRKLLRTQLSPRGKRFLAHLVYGTVRHQLLCDHILKRIVKQSLGSLPAAIHAILRMGVYQSLFSEQVTFPAMVHTSVELAHKRGHAGTARLVNACLRRAPQSIEEVTLPSRETQLLDHVSIRYSMPRWLVERWVQDFGMDETVKLCEVSNTEAPAAIRVNTLRTSPATLIERLAKVHIAAEKRTIVPEELTIVDGANLADNPCFREGLYLLQDPASMLPAHALEPQAGERVLDMCAAPGTKATHLAQLADDDAGVIAADSAYRRLRLILDNVDRLGLKSVAAVTADGRTPPFTGGFDKVLVDAPCTGLGTIRRHPDLKWRVRPEDAARLGALQEALLHSAIRLCKNGGVIVYSVCTLTKDETHDVCGKVLASGGVRLEDGPEWFSRWQIGPGQYQTLPSADGVDGFYLMRLRKSS